MFEDVLRALRLGLAGPLPGAAAHEAMMPEYLSCLDPDGAGAEGCRDASVLVLLYPSDGAVAFPLIVRPDTGGPHGGQIGLPGGSREEGESAVEAALRETEEELGVSASAIEILGELSEIYVPPSRFRVSPFVGWTSSRPEFRPSETEVAAILEPSLDELLDPANRRSEQRELGGRSWAIPYFALAGHVVWGATAKVLAELERMLRARLPEAQ